MKAPRRRVSPSEFKDNEALLKRVWQYCGYDVKTFARFTFDAAKYGQYMLLRRFVEINGGDFVEVLKKLGIVIAVKSGVTVVKDEEGIQEFRDDFFHSGLAYLLKPVEDLLLCKFPIPAPERDVNGLKALGMTGDDPVSFLVGFRERKEKLPLRMRLVAGNFVELRPLVLRDYSQFVKKLRYEVKKEGGKKALCFDPVRLLVADEVTLEAVKVLINETLVESSRGILVGAIEKRFATALRDKMNYDYREGRIGGEDGFLPYLLTMPRMNERSVFLGFLVRYREAVKKILSLLEAKEKK